MPVKVDENNFNEQVLDNGFPVLAEFYSDSCVACKRLAPILSELEDKYNGRLKIVKVNSTYQQELAGKYRIFSSPTLVFFSGREEIQRIRGVITKEALEEKIENLLQEGGTGNMNITVAGEKKAVPEGMTVAKLIEIENVETPQYVTVSLNDAFVESGQFAETFLSDGDSVEFLYYMGGGQ